MTYYKVCLLLVVYTTLYYARAENKPLIKEPHEWGLPSNPGKEVVKKLIQYFYGEDKDSAKESMEKQLENYNLVKDINLLSQQILDGVNAGPELITLNFGLSEIGLFLGKIDNVYRSFLQFSRSNMLATDFILRFWIDETRSDYNGPKDYLNTIFLKTFSTNNNHADFLHDTKILSSLVKNLKGYHNICDKGTSQQQIFFSFYQIILCALFKVSDVLEFCYQKLNETGNVDYNSEMRLLMTYVSEKYNITRDAFDNVIRVSSRKVVRCDPKTHIEGKTYVQLYYVFQKYVVHDNDIDGSGLCTTTCASVENSDSTVCYNDNRKSFYEKSTQQEETSICPQQRTCEGYFYDCEDFFVADKELWICPSDLNSTRRYEFILQGSTTVWYQDASISASYGQGSKKSDCNRTMAYDYRTLAQTINDIFSECEICLCTCYEHLNRKTQIFINGRAAVADANHVVTGARLVQQNNILHVQIEQGIIFDGGYINSSTVHWKPIAPIRESDHLIAIAPDCKDIYLGVTVVPNFRVIVGVAFAKVENRGKSVIVLRTLSATYNYHTGTVRRHFDEQNPEEKYYDEPQSPVDIDDSLRINLANSDVPTKNAMQNEPQSDSMRLIEITTTDFRKDVGQTVIPFFDIQPVTVRPPVPLSGIGFHYRGRPGFGGFIGIKLITYDYAARLN